MKRVLQAAAVLYGGAFVAALPVAALTFALVQGYAGRTDTPGMIAAARDPLIMADMLMQMRPMIGPVAVVTMVLLLGWLFVRVWFSGWSLCVLKGQTHQQARLNSMRSLWALFRTDALGIAGGTVVLVGAGLLAYGAMEVVEEARRATRAAMQLVAMAGCVATLGVVSSALELARLETLAEPDAGARSAWRRSLGTIRARPLPGLAPGVLTLFGALFVSWLVVVIDLRVVEDAWFPVIAGFVLQQLASFGRSFMWSLRAWLLVPFSTQSL